MIVEAAKRNLEKQHYVVVGNHSAVKICPFAKRDLKGGSGCYKSKFYGIRSHLCCQMTPSITCSNACVFCWRDLTNLHSIAFKYEHPDDPRAVINGAIQGQKKLLSGFGGNGNTNKEKFTNAQEPMHFAISLTGEPTQYPPIRGLIEGLHARGKSTFLVSNGQYPEQLEKVFPTQLYISLDAPNKECYKKTDRPLHPDFWERFLRSLDILREKRKQGLRTVCRITCVKKINMEDPNGYAELIKRAHPLFLEIKGYAFMGPSRYYLTLENTPSHEEVKAFAEEVGERCGYKLIDEDRGSRVVLYMQEDIPDRVMVWQDGRGEGDGYYLQQQKKEIA
ncbi:4-demethylwyosine synthase TYW1 [Candidatus Woesearchaeota archaeon]|nr:4-demethylwyosine synthase TYW1 [Candidatus Woesearchaeota archaeon]